MDRKYLLHKAVEAELVETVRFLLDQELDVNLRDANGNTPLHAAVSKDHEELVKMLLEVEANVRLKNHYDYTPLDSAVLTYDCKEEIVRLLITAGSNVNTTPAHGYSLLFLALTNRGNYFNKNVVKILKEAGAKLLEKDFTINPQGETALHVAVRNRNEELAKALIQSGMDLEAKPNTGMTPLFMSVEYYNDTNMIRMLLESGADPNVRSWKGKTALEHALDCGYLDAAEVLIGFKADVATRSEKGESVLHLAARESASSMVCNVDVLNKFLRCQNLDVNARDKSGRTPLHGAIKANVGKNYFDTLKTLMKNGADLGARDLEGETPLGLLKFHSKISPEVEEFLLTFVSRYTKVESKKEEVVKTEKVKKYVFSRDNEEFEKYFRKKKDGEKKDVEKTFSGTFMECKLDRLQKKIGETQKVFNLML